MAILKIYNLDDREEAVPISVLSIGEHIIGREKLNCKDKRVSRNHAVILIDEGSITMKSIHVNPSFFKANNGNSIKLIKKDDSVTLEDGDQFALLPDAFWFRVRVSKSQGHLKRINSQEMSGEGTKKVKTEDLNKSSSNDSFNFADLLTKTTNVQDFVNLNINSVDAEQNQDPNQLPCRISSTSEDNAQNITKTKDSAVDTKIHHKGFHLDSGISLDATKSPISQNEETKMNEDPSDSPNQIKTTVDSSSNNTANDNGNTTNNPSTSKVLKRMKCWYGENCYRKNPTHKVDFSHPGDDDFDTDTGDNQPLCPFGDECYRTNTNHRKQYKHLKPPVAKPMDNTANDNQNDSDSDSQDDNLNIGGKKRMAAKNTKNYKESPEDDYDLEDPFINDASSDEFKLSGDEEESDSEDLEEVKEESQETRRLLKEAKKFTKKKDKKNFWGI